MVASSDLEDLRDDTTGGEESLPTGESVVVARLSPTSKARAGHRSELWVDLSKLQFFDADSGESLTFKP